MCQICRYLEVHHMHPPIKNIYDDVGTDNPQIDASESIDNPTYVDQSKKDEADINYMLSRFGVVPPRGAPTYGEWDDSLDLQMAIHSVNEAKHAYQNLPEEIRRKFGSMEELLTAVENGSFQIKHEEAPPEPKTVEQIIEERLAAERAEHKKQSRARRDNSEDV